MIDQIEKYAAEKFPDNKEAAAQFVEGFIKEAGLFDNILNSPTGQGSTGPVKAPDTLQHTILKGIGSSLGTGIGSLAVTAGVTSVGNLYNSVRGAALHSKFLQALHRAVESNRILREADRQKVSDYAETIFKFAPNIATDSNILSSVLANAIHGEGIYPDTIKMLTDIESRYAENSGFNPKTFSK